MTGLRVSRSLALPADAVTEPIAILAVRGAGKTTTAVVMAEEMFNNGLHFVVIDPVGVWWGLRSSQDGKGPGLSIPIFGGKHGDLPLESTAGNFIADLVVGERLSCVLDVSEFSEGEKKKFLLDFATRIYRKNEDPLHLFLEEADDFIPQSPMRDEAHLLRAWTNIVRRGRSRGLGITMITQRSAAINKNVLTQAQTLIVLRTTSPQDKKAIQGWVEYHGQSKELVESLPGLENGEAWVWSPNWLGEFKKVRIRQRKTFDSSATPKGGKRRKVATLADVNLDSLEAQMSEAIERVQQEDPRFLKHRIRELEKELSKKKVETKTVEVPVPNQEGIDSLKSVFDDLNAVLGEDYPEFATEVESLVERQRQMHSSIEKVLKRAEDLLYAPMFVQTTKPEEVERIDRDLKAAYSVPSQMKASYLPEAMSVEPLNVKLKAGARRMLETLVEMYPLKLTRSQLATLSRLSPKSGTFATYFGTLRKEGLIAVQGEEVSLTEAGRAVVGHKAFVPRSPQELRDMWRGALKAGARRMLDVLIDAYPHDLSRDQLAARAELEGSSGTFATYLGMLRRNGLIEDGPGSAVRASETLFLGA